MNNQEAGKMEGLWLKGGTLVSPDSAPLRADVLVSGGSILAVGTDLASQAAGLACEAIDLTGCHVFPGFVDAHCHLRDPGQEYRRISSRGRVPPRQAGLRISPACPTPCP